MRRSSSDLSSTFRISDESLFFIYDMKNLLNLKDSPTDKGEEIFEQLLKERVIVK